MKKQPKSAETLDLVQFAEFNSKLFADPNASPEMFVPLTDPASADISADELE